MKNPIKICVEIIRETESALLVDDSPGKNSNEQWIPKSQITLNYDSGVGDTVDILMPEWLAKNKGFI